MSNLVLLKEALEYTKYSADHLRHLVRTGLVQGKQVGRIWMIDLDDLIRYEQQMDDLGPQKFLPKKADD